MSTCDVELIDQELEEKKQALEGFLSAWDKSYNDEMQTIDLFNRDLTSNWTLEQKQLFAKLLYHQRAHFDDVLWFVGNFAPGKEEKEMVLENISDELAMHGVSHEQLYQDFSASLGVDLTYELIDEKYYFPFLREYNYGHLKWLRDHDWNNRLSAFSAIERLDNIDYVCLKNVAESIGATGKALIFFNVHIYVEHYEQTSDLLLKLWLENAELVKQAYNFIADYQLEIWRKISDAVFKGYHMEKIESF